MKNKTRFKWLYSCAVGSGIKFELVMGGCQIKYQKTRLGLNGFIPVLLVLELSLGMALAALLNGLVSGTAVGVGVGWWCWSVVGRRLSDAE